MADFDFASFTTGAASGAAAGSVGGPWGAAAGGIAGGLASIFGGGGNGAPNPEHVAREMAFRARHGHSAPTGAMRTMLQQAHASLGQAMPGYGRLWQLVGGARPGQNLWIVLFGLKDPALPGFVHPTTQAMQSLAVQGGIVPGATSPFEQLQATLRASPAQAFEWLRAFAGGQLAAAAPVALPMAAPGVATVSVPGGPMIPLSAMAALLAQAMAELCRANTAGRAPVPSYQTPTQQWV